ncbi:MAG: hypothetical protein KJ709_05770 [Nanoarchaeota archaeon]|nr:hypothetical protein [Nanoarchaeota archaeon]
MALPQIAQLVNPSDAQSIIAMGIYESVERPRMIADDVAEYLNQDPNGRLGVCGHRIDVALEDGIHAKLTGAHLSEVEGYKSLFPFHVQMFMHSDAKDYEETYVLITELPGNVELYTVGTVNRRLDTFDSIDLALQLDPETGERVAIDPGGYKETFDEVIRVAATKVWATQRKAGTNKPWWTLTNAL